MKVTAEQMWQAAELVKDYLISTNYHIAAFSRVMGYIEQVETENARLKERDPMTESEEHRDAEMIRNNIMHIFMCNSVRPEQARAILKSCLNQLHTQEENTQ